jgi:hypothetical protein
MLVKGVTLKKKVHISHKIIAQVKYTLSGIHRDEYDYHIHPEHVLTGTPYNGFLLFA